MSNQSPGADGEELRVRPEELSEPILEKEDYSYRACAKILKKEHWSVPGQYADEVIPLMQEAYDEGFRQGMKRNARV